MDRSSSEGLVHKLSAWIDLVIKLGDDLFVLSIEFGNGGNNLGKHSILPPCSKREVP